MQIVHALQNTGPSAQWSTVEEKEGRVHICTVDGLAIRCFIQVPHCRWSRLPVDCLHGPPTDEPTHEAAKPWRAPHEPCSGCFGCVKSLTELDKPSSTGYLAQQVKRYARGLGVKRNLEAQDHYLNIYWTGSLVWKIRVNGIDLRSQFMFYHDGKRVVIVGRLIIKRCENRLSVGYNELGCAPLLSWDVYRNAKEVQELHATLLYKGNWIPSGLAKIHKAFVFLLANCQYCQRPTEESACRSSPPHPVVCCLHCGCEHCDTLFMRLQTFK